MQIKAERVDAWARSHLSDESYEIFAQIPASAGMIMTFEELMELNGQPQFLPMMGHFQEDLLLMTKSMQNDPRCWKKTLRLSVRFRMDSSSML